MQSAESGAPLAIPQRVGEQGWGQNLAQRVMWMVGRDLQAAELKLNPAHLGPLEIKVTMHQHDQASVTLLANNHAVRDALEQALPRLRDMLGQQDIQLVQADVGQRQEARQGGAGGQLGGQQTPAGNGGQSDGTDGIDSADGVPEDTLALRGQGLVDAYA
jgi:flagellar hook-length control protein FliK